MNPATDTRIVVNMLTGFLGSGRTTLLRRLLGSEAFSNCAVLVNELGEVALDHELLETLDHETVVLRSGCICCGVRSDMAEALALLEARRARGEVPPFDRVVVETTGLADPVPIINTILSDDRLRHHFRLGTVVTTLDAVHGVGQLIERAEARKQVAVADRIVLTKADLVASEMLARLADTATAINPYCTMLPSYDDAGEAEVAMSVDLGGGPRALESERWMGAATQPTGNLFSGSGLFTEKGRELAPLHGGIRSATLVVDEPLDWVAFGVWLSMLLHRHGAAILRVKGILNLRGVSVPTVVHGVQHLLHPPTHLPAWPSADHRSRLVLIGELPDTESLRLSLELMCAVADR